MLAMPVLVPRGERGIPQSQTLGCVRQVATKVDTDPVLNAGHLYDQDITAIEAGGEALTDTRLKAVLTFVDACVASPAVSDSTFAAASGVLSRRDLATVIVLVGHYMMVARLLGILQVQLDEQPIPGRASNSARWNSPSLN